MHSCVSVPAQGAPASPTHRHGPAPNATRIVSVVVSRMFEETCVWHTTNSLEVVCEHEFQEHTQYVAQKVHIGAPLEA